MIEVERKFILQPGDKERLLQGASLLSEKMIRDEYFDTPTLDLLPKEILLRRRDGIFELKVPKWVVTQKQPDTYQFDEFADEAKIRHALHLPIRGSFIHDVGQAGYITIADFVTTRAKCSRDGFSLDFDTADFGFGVLEIELIVENESQIAEATEKILAFAKQAGLSADRPLSKLHEYLRLKNPALFNVLKHAWQALPAGE